MNDSALASVSMGYQIGVTPLQMAAAVSAVANGGEYIEPRIVRAVVRDGRRSRCRRRRPAADRQHRDGGGADRRSWKRSSSAVPAETAQIDGYHDRREDGYRRESHRRALLDVARTTRRSSGSCRPASPALTILVVIDSPHGEGLLRRHRRGADLQADRRSLAAPSRGPADNQPDAACSRRKRARETRAVPPGEANRLRTIDGSSPGPLIERHDGLMPDLHGLSAREALRTLAQLGLAARMTGNGFVVDQRPAPGVPLARGETCDLTLNRLATTPPSPSRGTSQ